MKPGAEFSNWAILETLAYLECSLRRDRLDDSLDGQDRFTTFSRAVAEPHLIQPTIIYEFPTAVSPLSKQKPDDPDRVERFEIYIGGFELGNAFSELNDPVEQHKRFERATRRARPRRRRSAPDGRGLRARAGLRPASHRRRRHRHRPAGDAADRLQVDSGCDSLSADEKRNREQGTGIRDQRNPLVEVRAIPPCSECEMWGTSFCGKVSKSNRRSFDSSLALRRSG